MKRSTLFATTLILSFCPVTVWALTVDEAYQAIPHTHTPYDASVSPRAQAEKDFLTRLFVLSDRALVERIETLQALSSGNPGRFDAYRERAGKIRRELAVLSEPSTATGLSRALSDAINHQEKFFAKWSTALKEHREFSSPLRTDGDVKAASETLIRLYSELMSRFANEAAHNRDAFYQHLCALDFL